MKRFLPFLILFGITVLSCEREKVTFFDTTLKQALISASPTGTWESFVMPESDDFANIPNQDPKNRITQAKVNLGKMLFFETGIGLHPNKATSTGTYSCSSCHIPSKAFTAGRFQGIADGGIGFGKNGEGRVKNPLYYGHEVDAQGARPLPTINLAYVTNALWAGSFGSFGVNVGTESVWNQDTLIAVNFKGLEGLEANNIRALSVHRQFMDRAIADTLGYKAMYDEAFPEIPEQERYTLTTTSFAIAAYFRTIFTNQAPFQKWLKGDHEAMTDQQKRGALLFFGKAGCSNCHKSPSLNAMNFFAIGVNNLYQGNNEVFRTGPDDKRNFGRGGFTENPEDNNKFKVPQLYNLKDVGFYFHGASKNSLREVVEYFNEAVPENPLVDPAVISPFFKPLNLTEAEIDDLVEFLENGLYDPDLERYRPEIIMSGNCFPNNDPLSRSQMRCD